MKDRSTMGQRLKLAMDEESITSNAKLADEIGTTGATIGNWIADKVKPDEVKAELALRLCQKLRIRPEWLILNEGPMRPAGVPVKPKASELETARNRLDSVLAAQMAIVKVLAETIPTTGRALADEFDKLPADAGGDLAAAHASIARRALANQEIALAQHPAPASRGPAGRKKAR